MTMPAERIASLFETLPPLRGRAQADASLAPFTWFRVGGPAEVLVRPADADDLAAFLRALPLDIQVRVIGACSNLIIRDGGLPGVTVKLARGFSAIEAEANGVVAGAAALDLTVSEHAAAAGLTGLEFLSGIPGTIGGAMTMNAGAYGGEVGPCRRLGGRGHTLRRATPHGRGGAGVRLPACAAAAWRGGDACAAARLSGRAGHNRCPHERDPCRARGVPTGACTHRRFHVPQPARHEGVGTDRCAPAVAA